MAAFVEGCGAAELFVVGEKFKELSPGILGVYFGDDVCDAVVGIGDEGCADCAHVFATGHFLFLPHAEGLVYGC